MPKSKHKIIVSNHKGKVVLTPSQMIAKEQYRTYFLDRSVLRKAIAGLDDEPGIVQCTCIYKNRSFVSLEFRVFYSDVLRIGCYYFNKTASKQIQRWCGGGK